MKQTLEFLAHHGPAFLFAVVFIEQMGIPLPATPWLLAGGALAAVGEVNLTGAIAAATAGSILADAIWFHLGRFAGQRVLSLLCRISLEPDTCVRKTENLFTRQGMRGIVVAKFVPGLSTIAPPLAGNSGVPFAKFLFFDGMASLFYAGGFICAGVAFSDQLERLLAVLEHLGGAALLLVVALLALYIANKYRQRRAFVAELKMARITIDELQQLIATDRAPVIIDVRGRQDIAQSSAIIQGALQIQPGEIDDRASEIPSDRDIVLFCACPDEASAARVALRLKQKGFQRVRPLLGGIDAWQARNLAVDRPAPRLGEISV